MRKKVRKKEWHRESILPRATSLQKTREKLLVF